MSIGKDAPMRNRGAPNHGIQSACKLKRIPLFAFVVHSLQVVRSSRRFARDIECSFMELILKYPGTSQVVRVDTPEIARGLTGLRYHHEKPPDKSGRVSLLCRQSLSRTW
jgi:hypothetical protein